MAGMQDNYIRKEVVALLQPVQVVVRGAELHSISEQMEAVTQNTIPLLIRSCT